MWTRFTFLLATVKLHGIHGGNAPFLNPNEYRISNITPNIMSSYRNGTSRNSPPKINGVVFLRWRKYKIKKLGFGPKWQKHTNFVKLCWFFVELWRKNRQILLNFFWFLCCENIILFDGYFATTRLKINTIWQNWYVFVFWTKTQLFYLINFSAYVVQKYVFAFYSKSPRSKILLFYIFWKLRTPAFRGHMPIFWQFFGRKWQCIFKGTVWASDLHDVARESGLFALYSTAKNNLVSATTYYSTCQINLYYERLLHTKFAQICTKVGLYQ